MLSAIVSISATMQVTIVHGGPEVFGGAAVAVTIGGGEAWSAVRRAAQPGPPPLHWRDVRDGCRCGIDADRSLCPVSVHANVAWFGLHARRVAGALPWLITRNIP